MLDREGYRPNVGIILVNQKNEVFWGKRIREKSWQFPQGGIKYGENPTQAMYRELYEELGLRQEHVQILGRTQNWIRYNVPEKYIRRESRGYYKGQKQIWFLLRLVSKDKTIRLRASNHPEFDAWRWSTYWVPLDQVIEFKRGVYIQALKELSPFLNGNPAKSDTRFLRQKRYRKPLQSSTTSKTVQKTVTVVTTVHETMHDCVQTTVQKAVQVTEFHAAQMITQATVKAAHKVIQTVHHDRCSEDMIQK